MPKTLTRNGNYPEDLFGRFLRALKSRPQNLVTILSIPTKKLLHHLKEQ